jgi:hypothetical protein
MPIGEFASGLGHNHLKVYLHWPAMYWIILSVVSLVPFFSGAIGIIRVG